MSPKTLLPATLSLLILFPGKALAAAFFHGENVSAEGQATTSYGDVDLPGETTLSSTLHADAEQGWEREVWRCTQRLELRHTLAWENALPQALFLGATGAFRRSSGNGGNTFSLFGNRNDHWSEADTGPLGASGTWNDDELVGAAWDSDLEISENVRFSHNLFASRYWGSSLIGSLGGSLNLGTPLSARDTLAFTFFAAHQNQTPGEPNAWPTTDSETTEIQPGLHWNHELGESTGAQADIGWALVRQGASTDARAVGGLAYSWAGKDVALRIAGLRARTFREGTSIRLWQDSLSIDGNVAWSPHDSTTGSARLGRTEDSLETLEDTLLLSLRHTYAFTRDPEARPHFSLWGEGSAEGMERSARSLAHPGAREEIRQWRLRVGIGAAASL